MPPVDPVVLGIVVPPPVVLGIVVSPPVVLAFVVVGFTYNDGILRDGAVAVKLTAAAPFRFTASIALPFVSEIGSTTVPDPVESGLVVELFTYNAGMDNPGTDNPGMDNPGTDNPGTL